MFKNKPFWFSIVVLAAYLLTAYFAVPQWLQPRLEQYVKLQWNKSLQFEQIKFDPLTWSAVLTEVRFADEPGNAGKPSLLPDTTLTADSVHLRFNFWRLRAAVSTLILKSPVLTIDGNSRHMQSGRYPFVSQWQQWRLKDGSNQEHQPVSIRQVRVDGGSVVLTYPGTQNPDKTLLDALLLDIEKLDEGGQREYHLAFTAEKGSAISVQGQLDLENLTSNGQYQWAAKLSQAVYPGFQQAGTQVGTKKDIHAEGEFKISTQDDSFLISLAESTLNSAQAERCVLDALLCARIYPLNGTFSATLQASTQGVELLSAEMQQAAFELDASLAQGAVLLRQRQAFEAAHLKVNALPAATNVPGQQGPADSQLEFDLALQTASDPLLNVNVNGQIHPESEQFRMTFSSRGEQEFGGDSQWQWIATQQGEAAYPRLQLRLENPGASLAQGFMAEHLSDPVAAAALQMEFTAELHPEELRFDENIRLMQVSPSQTTISSNVPPDVSQGLPQNARASDPTGATPMDAAWLLALLQNPQSDIELDLPEQHIPLTEQLSLNSLIEVPLQEYLDRISAQPFEGLALQMGQEGHDLAEVQFESGSAELNAESFTSLTVLAEALSLRPGLGIELAGVYDSLIDKRALQTEQIRTHIALAMAADLAFQSGSQPPDFTDPVVHSVIDEFARRRLPPQVLKDFTGHFGEADVDRGVLPEGNIANYYSTLFELLVDFAEIPQGALSTLARYRAQAVIELLAGKGVPRERLQAVPEPRTSAAELNGVPLHLELNIWSQEDQAGEDSTQKDPGREDPVQEDGAPIDPAPKDPEMLEGGNSRLW